MCLLGRWALWEFLLLSCTQFPEFLTYTGVGSCLGSVTQESFTVRNSWGSPYLVMPFGSEHPHI